MVTYEFEPGVLVVRLVGHYSLEEVLHNLRAALDDPRFRPGVSLLFDACESEESRTPQELIKVADFLKTTQHLLGPRSAAIACDPLRFGTAMGLAGWSASRGIEVRVFEGGEGEAARAWLRGAAVGTDRTGA